MSELIFLSHNEKETSDFGRKLAAFSRKGDVFALYGTLGMGKSVLARAFVRRFITNAEVPSPTFTLLQTYDTPDFEIYHFDLYRLKTAEEIFELGMEEALSEGVSLIEWPERMKDYLPRKTFKITINSAEGGRIISLSAATEENIRRLSEWERI